MNALPTDKMKLLDEMQDALFIFECLKACNGQLVFSAEEVAQNLGQKESNIIKAVNRIRKEHPDLKIRATTSAKTLPSEYFKAPPKRPTLKTEVKADRKTKLSEDEDEPVVKKTKLSRGGILDEADEGEADGGEAD